MAPAVRLPWRQAGPALAAAEELFRGKAAGEVVTAAQAKAQEARAAGDKAGEASAFVALARGYFAMDMPAPALSSAVEARRLLREAGAQQEEFGCLLMIAELQLSKGLADEASNAGREALALSQERSDRASEAAAQEVLAAALLAQSLGDEALRAAARGLALGKDLGDAARQGSASRQMAQAHLAKGSGAAAAQKAEEAEALYRSAQDKVGEAGAVQTLAEAYLLQNDAEAALKACDRAVALCGEAGDGGARAHVLLVAAQARASKGEQEAGLRAAREALQLFREVGDAHGAQLARETCAELRRKPERSGAAAIVSGGGSAAQRLGSQCVPGVSGPGSITMSPCVSTQRICGTAETRKLTGMVTVVTGASRGIGKGVSQMLAEAGAIVYCTGRPASGKPGDGSAPGSVDATASAFTRYGGAGVAVHADHSQDAQNRALMELVAQNHGRVDILVNSDIDVPSADKESFSVPDWAQSSAGGDAKTQGTLQTAQTALFAPALRRGRGVVVNLGAPDPAEEQKRRLPEALSSQLAARDVHAVSMCTGPVKTERAIAQAKETGSKLIDMESTRFSGQTVVNLLSMRPDEMSRFASTHAALSSADAARFELDGYKHQGGLRSFSSSARAVVR